MHSIQNLNLNPLNVFHEVVSLIGQGSWVIAGKLAIFSYQELELVAQLIKHLCSVSNSPGGKYYRYGVSFMTMRLVMSTMCHKSSKSLRWTFSISKFNLRAQGTSSECSESQLNHEPPSRDLPPLGNMV